MVKGLWEGTWSQEMSQADSLRKEHGSRGPGHQFPSTAQAQSVAELRLPRSTAAAPSMALADPQTTSAPGNVR